MNLTRGNTSLSTQRIPIETAGGAGGAFLSRGSFLEQGEERETAGGAFLSRGSRGRMKAPFN